MRRTRFTLIVMLPTNNQLLHFGAREVEDALSRTRVTGERRARSSTGGSGDFGRVEAPNDQGVLARHDLRHV
jgi:hypothetical protein